MTPSARSQQDATVAAVDTARAALLEHTPAEQVGEYLGHRKDAERLVTHLFACTAPGYRGWTWSVTVVRAARQRTVTVDEVVLVPGAEAVVAPEWVPYKERVQPGDLSPGDLLPVSDDDPRLVPARLGEEDPEPDDRTMVREVTRELGLERERTLSPEGRDLAAERWYAGSGGPATTLARSAPRPCGSCGFLVRLSGPLQAMFGVCANGNANDDGRVVSLDHGCGAHSEVQLARKQQPQPLPEHVHDTFSTEELETF